MKLTPVFLAALSICIYSCNPQSSDATGNDSSAVVEPEPLPEAKPGRDPAGAVIEFPGADSAFMGEYVYKTTYFTPHQLMKVEMLAKEFRPEEVFLEILKRSGKMKKDTIVPRPYAKNYSWPKVKMITQKNQALQGLEFIDVLSLYERVAQRFGRRVIYDLDDREEVVYNCDDLSNPNPSRADMCSAKSVAAVISSYQLEHEPGVGYKLSNYTVYGEGVTYCNGESFLKQPAAAKCSAFVYDSVTLITTAHDLTVNSIKRYSFVFDYIVGADKGQPRTVFPESCVYKAKSARFIPDMDMCIITLDKEIDHRRIPVFSSSKATMNDTFYVIGCPVGIPFKLAGKATILDNNANLAFFKINSDTYRGNSGSPVFNARTHQVEGFLAEGEVDNIGLDDVVCSKVINCGEEDCATKGEKVIRTSYFMQMLKQ